MVYVLISARTSHTYVGITVDLERRLAQHNGMRPGGAKRTRAGRPWTLGKSLGPYSSRGEALRIERQVKRLRGHARLEWKADP